MKETVDVSIITANYNNGSYLSDFIESVINSTVLPQQLIIIDDGSTDNSNEIFNQYADLKFLEVIRFDKNYGFTAALNAGLEKAKSKYIMRADPDDKLMPERIEKQYQFLENQSETDVVGCNVIYFNDLSGEPINSSNFPLNHTDIESAFRKGEHGVQHPTVFIRGYVYRKYSYQPIFPGEDYELFARMIRDGIKFANLPENLYLMRVHSNSSTTNLKYEAIRQTFEFRDSIFNTKTSKWWIYMYYFHVRHYRKYQISKNVFIKYFHLLLSVITYPQKLVKRIIK